MPCVVMFGATEKGPHSVGLDLEADVVAQELQASMGGFARFETKRGKAVWINPANVLWVEDRTPSGAASF